MSSQLDLFDDNLLMPAMKAQLTGNSNIIKTFPATPNVYFDAPEIDLSKYDHFLVFMSGGKDSIASLKYLLDRGVRKDQIELHHHLVDGAEGSSLVDWPFMHAYNQKIAEAMGLPLYNSWLSGGFEGEMLKQDSISKPDIIETPTGTITLPRSAQAKPATRRKFPQQAASLQTRWCSSYLKIALGSRLIRAQERFIGKNILYVSGERSQGKFE